MKTFQEILEGKTKTDLPEIPAIKKPAKAKTTTKREEIPGLGAKVIEPVEETITEGVTFKSSIDATEYMSNVVDGIVAVRLLANDSKLASWCKITDSNFGTKSSVHYRQLIKQLDELRKTAQRIEDEMLSV